MLKLKADVSKSDLHNAIPIAGGHKGSISSYQDRKVLLKKACTVELNFYKDVFDASASIGNYMPRLLGIESDGTAKQLMMQNLAEGMTAPVVIDIKLGKHTSSFNELTKNWQFSKHDAAFKVMRNRTVDLISTSSHLGFRIVRHSKSDLSKWRSGLANPEQQIRGYLPDNAKTQNMILADLKRIHDFVMSPEFENYELIGSSQLIIYDENSPEADAKLALIDFAHSSRKVFPHSQETHEKYVDNYRRGFSNLVELFEHCSNVKSI